MVNNNAIKTNEAMLRYEAGITFGYYASSWYSWSGFTTWGSHSQTKTIVFTFLDIIVCFRWPRINSDLVRSLRLCYQGLVYFTENEMVFRSVASTSQLGTILLSSWCFCHGFSCHWQSQALAYHVVQTQNILSMTSWGEEDPWDSMNFVPAAIFIWHPKHSLRVIHVHFILLFTD